MRMLVAREIGFKKMFKTIHEGERKTWDGEVKWFSCNGTYETNSRNNLFSVRDVSAGESGLGRAGYY